MAAFAANRTVLRAAPIISRHRILMHTLIQDMEEIRGRTHEASAFGGLRSTFSATTGTLLDGNSDASTLAQRALQMEQELQAIRERKNSLLSINCIAPEILAKIFMTLELDEANSLFKAGRNKLAWLNVTHVCRHWRSVGLDYAPLWTRLRCSVHPEMTKLMLARSKGALLDIAIEGERTVGKDLEGTLCEALSQVDRLKSVALGNYRGSSTKLRILLAKIKGPAPNLRKLTIQGTVHSPYSLSPGFLLGGAPALELLQLLYVTIAWNAIPLPAGLTVLYLHKAAVRPLPKQFFASMKNLPLLKRLTLVDYLPGSSPCYTPPQIRLPALKMLHIRDACRMINQFMQSVQTPRVASVSTMLTDNKIPATLLDSYFANVKIAVLGVIKNSGVDRFSVRCFDGLCTQFPSFELLWHVPPTVSVTKEIEVTFSFRNSTTIVFGPAYASLNTHFNLTTAHNLTLEESCYTGPSAATFKSVMVKLPKVERLCIVSGYFPTIISAMNADPALLRSKEAGRGFHPSTPYLPALSSIVLRDVYLDVDIDPLISLLAERPRAHHIGTLRIYECKHFDQFGFDRLGKRLQRVQIVWDGREHWDSEDEVDHMWI